MTLTPLLVMLTLLQPGGAEPWSPPSEDAATFAPIVALNIFNPNRDGLRQARERAEAPPPPPPTLQPAAPPPPPPDPIDTHVLVGISQRGDETVAFVEDRTTAQVYRLTEGDAVAEGVVRTIAADTVRFEHEGQMYDLHPGLTMRGEAPATALRPSPRPAAPSAAPSSTPSGEPAANDAASSAEAEILRRLRERRQRESTP